MSQRSQCSRLPGPAKTPTKPQPKRAHPIREEALLHVPVGPATLNKSNMAVLCRTGVRNGEQGIEELFALVAPAGRGGQLE